MKNRIRIPLRPILLALAAGWAWPLMGLAQDDVEKDRAQRLDQLARALERIKIERLLKPVKRESDGRQYSKASALHLNFQACAAGVNQQTRDGVLVFGIQASGFASMLDPRQKPVRDSGSDLRDVRVTIQALLNSEVKRPKAKLDVPDIKHGSLFPAAQIARDEIQKYLQFIFPEVDIDGIQRFEEKRLAIHNRADEPIVVFAQYEERVHVERGWNWTWRPGAPKSERVLKCTVPPKSTKVVEAGKDEEKEPIHARRVLVWAESESGERWDQHRWQPLWLLEPNPKSDNARAYRSEKIQTYTHEIAPSNEIRQFAERALELKNNTPEDLAVHLRYRANRGGALIWDTVELTIPAGKSVRPRTADDLRVRASRVEFEAESANRQYVKYSKQPLWLTEKLNGKRSYWAKTIGTFQYTFEPAATGAAAERALITADNVNVKSGDQTVGVARRDQRLEVLGKQAGWIKVALEGNGESKSGWVRQNEVRLVAPPAPQAADAGSFVKIKSATAGVYSGKSTVGTVNRGEEYRILDRKGAWLKIGIENEGQTMEGWIRQQDATL